MVSRYLEQQAGIVATLVEPHIWKNLRDVVTLSENDISNLENLVVILKPLKDITTVLCDEKLPTVSLIYPMKMKIISSLTLLQEDTTLIRSVKQDILTNLQKRYTNPETEEFLIISAALDPRFKCLPQLTMDKRNAIFSTMTQKAIEFSEKKTVIKTEPEDPQEKLRSDTLTDPVDEVGPSCSKATALSTGSKSSSTIKDLFADVFIEKVERRTKTLQDMVTEEVSSYRKEESIPVEGNPLLWWKVHGDKYSYLSHLAKYHLGIPGTSVPSERIFSTAGDIVSAQRATLNKDSVDSLIFIKKIRNYKQMD